MSAHVLLSWGKEIKCDACRAFFLSLSRNDLNKFNKTGARMIDSIYHMALKLIKNLIVGEKRQYYDILYAVIKWTSLRNVTKHVNH